MVARYGHLTRFFAFSLYERDRWVARQARRIPPRRRVLDVGAGPCRYRHLFRHCRYQAHDFAQLQPGQGGWTAEYGELDYVSDITAIPVPDGSIDVVLCTEVLEHVPEPIAALREISRILKPGGILLLTAPQRSGGHLQPYHFYGGFTPQWYRHFLPQFGLEVLVVQPNGGFFRAYGEESQRFVTMLFPAGRALRKRVLFPIYVALKARALAACLSGYFLDILDDKRDFATGYHVRAVKVRARPESAQPASSGGD